MTDKPDRLWAPWRLEYIKSAMDTPSDCFLCDAVNAREDETRLLLYRDKTSFAILNIYPYNNGHLLIAPNSHVSDLNDLSTVELTSLFDLVRHAKGWIEAAYSPHGFNIGINLGRTAGAGLPDHIHVHIVPRWDGDTSFMPVTGGVKVISEGLKSTYDQLKKVIELDKD